MSNVSYKEVSATRSTAWQQKAEEHAGNGTSFVVRPFRKEVHWPFLQDLCERFHLIATFNALERAAYFDATPGH